MTGGAASMFSGTAHSSGSRQRIRRALKAHLAKLRAAEEAEIEASGYFSEPDWQEVVSPDGVRCFVTRFRDAPKPRGPTNLGRSFDPRIPSPEIKIQGTAPTTSNGMSELACAG